MNDLQRNFIEFALAERVLRFGDFVLKSGRESPYFFNSGLFNHGKSLSKLARFYAAAISSARIEFDMLYGPAYKGIPLVAGIAVALADYHNRDLPYAFNRKEAKDHGEKGMIVGAPLRGRVLMVDDVISAGTSTRESVAIIGAANATPVGVVIALDRQERGQGNETAIEELSRELGLDILSIVNLNTLIGFLETDPARQEQLEQMKGYRTQYGPQSGLRG